MIDIPIAILASSTAQAIIKYLDHQLGDYIGKKYPKEAPENSEALKDFKALKEEIQEMKTKLASAEASKADVEKIRNTIINIEKKQSTSSDNIGSNLSFLIWSEKKLAIEDQAPIAERKLQMLLDETREPRINIEKRLEIEKYMALIDTNRSIYINTLKDFAAGLATNQELANSKIHLHAAINGASSLFNERYGADSC
jgi:hypothetical protein